MENGALPWNISLHGGHSGEFCEHAAGTLEQIVCAAIARRMPAYGLTEHAPRLDAAFLFEEEREKGYTVQRLEAEFAAYARESQRLVDKYGDEIELLRGFEIETVPPAGYREIMLELRSRYHFDYLVGSVHFVGTHTIDYTADRFRAAAQAAGGIEALAVKYYESVETMIQALSPEVLAHFDLIRKFAPDESSVATPVIRAAAQRALDAAAAAGCILDINTGGLRKGLGRPYPAPWVLEAALSRGIGACFGDDAHRAEEVGAGIPEARAYLLDNGYREITALSRTPHGLARRKIPLH